MRRKVEVVANAEGIARPRLGCWSDRLMVLERRPIRGDLTEELGGLVAGVGVLETMRMLEDDKVSCSVTIARLVCICFCALL